MLSSVTVVNPGKILEEAHFIPVTVQEVQEAYLSYLGEQFQNYFHTTIGANPGEATPAIVEEDSQFDAEHVDGILRYLIGQDPNLADHVGLFPTFNQDAFFRQACDLVVNKMNRDPRFNKLVKDTSPLIEVSECVDFPDLLEERNAQERYRTQQDQEANENAVRILSENEIFSDNLFTLYLQAIAGSKNANVGNKTNTLLSFADCDQFIIPIRHNQHYTVAVIHCDNEESSAVIQYYDSLGRDLNENDKNQLVMAFEEIGFDKVEYQCLSKRQQISGDYYNCGLFAAFKGYDLVNEKLGNSKRILESFENEYDAFFNYLRNRATEMLRESGCNIALSPELVESIKQDQIERDNKEKVGYFGWMYRAASSFFITKKQGLDELEEGEPRILLANKYWNLPSAALLHNAGSEFITSSEEESLEVTPPSIEIIMDSDEESLDVTSPSIEIIIDSDDESSGATPPPKKKRKL